MRLIRIIAMMIALGPVASLPETSAAQVDLTVSIAPPALPVYEPPAPPSPYYVWAPGYWAWGVFGYYWVPGTWVQPPVGLLWTPGYWGWRDGYYAWNEGYWAPHVGYYGGIHYGYGYDGYGFHGGMWNHGHFIIDHDVYHAGFGSEGSHISFNGPGGINVRASAEEMAYSHERHVPPTHMQMQHFQAAAKNPQLRLSLNHGKPAIAATAKPGDFHGHGVVAARAAGPVERPQAQQARPAAAPASRPHVASPQVDRNMRNSPEHWHQEHPSAQPAMQQQQERPEARPAQPAEPLKARSPYTVRNATVGGYRPTAPQPQQHAPAQRPAEAPHAEAHPQEHHEEEHR